MTNVLPNLMGRIVSAPAWGPLVQRAQRQPNFTLRLHEAQCSHLLDWLYDNIDDTLYLILPFDQFDAKRDLGVYARESLVDPTIPYPTAVEDYANTWDWVIQSIDTFLTRNPNAQLTVLLPELASGLVPLQGYLRVYFNLLTAWFSQLTARMSDVTYHPTANHYCQLHRLPTQGTP